MKKLLKSVICGTNEQCTGALFTVDLSTMNSAPVHSSRVSQIPLFSNFFIKNGSHSTIYTFKNYFATVFSISVFSFSKNKLNPNTPFIYIYIYIYEPILHNLCVPFIPYGNWKWIVCVCVFCLVMSW